MSKTFEQGWAARPFKEQFPALDDKNAERLDKLNHAITLLRVNGMLTDSAHRDIREKKMPKAVEAALNSAAQPTQGGKA